ncbi:response regulator [Paraburkholderia caballeronis]|uniref:Response regulator receiver domain-containing protein n=1 Tax=Paraburkholderia caballeronis TaxID=416943 RepID=A0A1H7P4I2_9BURK|nr:response regulator transcription factor [Paraburkholderia caballeronis]PXW25386.1 response regulator receiver protein [Paraburkholderia caballeronis]PXX00993.1 response regulator receiver protein [Paraburkholderia caballeronis]RAJ99654.1 response regulator receiver protein [Paraburkholderia caballeronis]SEE39496.1 response regulator receiver protein [Paraburkholderia caballeronis]SEL30683.1 Response regulator receiver domain-containing protein [Paraburkholderia caballeronis]
MDASQTNATLNVFLVEDAGAVRQRIADALSAIPRVAVVGEAEDAPSALDGILATGADVAVVDLRLIDSSGIDVISGLSRERPEVVKLVLTNHSGPAFREACETAGADFFFDKTSEFDAACRTIEVLVQTRAARRAP